MTQPEAPDSRTELEASALAAAREVAAVARQRAAAGQTAAPTLNDVVLLLAGIAEELHTANLIATRSSLAKTSEQRDVLDHHILTRLDLDLPEPDTTVMVFGP